MPAQPGLMTIAIGDMWGRGEGEVGGGEVVGCRL